MSLLQGVNDHYVRSVDLALAAFAGVASAQDFELEGKINAINSTARTITVMGTVVSMPAGMKVDTPTGTLSIAQPLQHRYGALPVIWRAQAVALVLTAPLGASEMLDAHWTRGPLLSILAL